MSSSPVNSWSLLFLIPVLLMMCCNVECQLPTFNITSPMSLFSHQIQHSIQQLNAFADVAALFG